MPFDPETVYVTLEGGIVLLITDVTDEYTPTDVEIYDGETYRNEIDAGFIGTARSLLVDVSGGVGSGPVAIPNGSNLNVVGGSGDTIAYSAVSDPHLEQSDSFTGTPPHFKAKKRTLYSFPRDGKFTHVTWGDLVIGTSPVPPYKLGTTPTPIA